MHLAISAISSPRTQWQMNTCNTYYQWPAISIEFNGSITYHTGARRSHILHRCLFLPQDGLLSEVQSIGEEPVDGNEAEQEATNRKVSNVHMSV